MVLNPAKPRGPYRKANRILRFWSKTRVAGDCLLWTGGTDGRYGSFTVTNAPKRRTVKAHRWIFEQVFGEQPRDREIRHTCDTPGCVKLQHLEVGSHKQNMQECADRGRLKIGGRVASVLKLSDEQVTEIRWLCAFGVSQHQIARHYDVRPQTINGIALGKSRKESSAA